MDSWRRFWRLPRQEKFCFLQAVAWLPLTVLGIRGVGPRRWMDFLEWVSPLAASSRPQQSPEAIARMVAAAARRSLFSSSCLSRSVALWWFFRRRGIAAELRFGGRKEGDVLEAHAWVEADGKVFDLTGTTPEGFVPLDRPVATGEGKPQ